MTAIPRVSLAIQAPNNNLKNDAPLELLQLAKAAISAGFQEVHLGFEGLGAEEPSPGGWLLYLTKLDSGNRYMFNGKEHAEVDESKIDERMQLRVTSHRKGLIGDETWHETEAYVGGEEMYWGAEKIREWIGTGHFLTSEVRERLGLRPDDKLISDEAAQAAYDRMETGYLNGWSVKHVLRLDTALAMRRFADPDEPSFGHLFLEIEAINNFYNAEWHPQHRDAGGKLNTSHKLILVDSQSANLGPEATLLSYEDYEEIDSGRVDNLEDSRFYRALTNTAPWFVRVAGQVEDDEEAGMDGYWAFAPESRPELG